MAGIPWNEKEIKATIRAYFRLLDSQLAGKNVVKKDIYEKLHIENPKRSAKSFELKFQNISAILYEEGLQYADGLKPKFNYQLLLKLLVLNHLDRTKRPAASPKEILVREMQLLWSRGFLPVTESGTGRFGLALERHLGIPPNSSKKPDFMGIELKTKHDKSLQTLFSKVPTKYIGCANKRELIEKFGYYDEIKERQALYTSISSKGDALGFSLKCNNDYISVYKNGQEILRYDCDILEDALLSKHAQTAYISVSKRRDSDGTQLCRFDQMIYCRQPSMRRLLKLLKRGQIHLDPLLSIKNGKIKDNGFLWKVQPDSIPELYLSVEVVKLGSGNDLN